MTILYHQACHTMSLKVGGHCFQSPWIYIDFTIERKQISWWIQPIRRILVKMVSFPQIGVKIKNIWNHHPANFLVIGRESFLSFLTQSHVLPFQRISFPRNFNTSPEHRSSPNEISSSNHGFSGVISVFSGCILYNLSKNAFTVCFLLALLMFPGKPFQHKICRKKICCAEKRSFKKCCRGCFARKSSKNCRYISVSNLRKNVRFSALHTPED